MERTRALIQSLNAFVLDHGGRVYLAKDAFTDAVDFRRMYPRWEAFQAVRDEWDPDRRLSSAQSHRLFGDPTPVDQLPSAHPEHAHRGEAHGRGAERPGQVQNSAHAAATAAEAP